MLFPLDANSKVTEQVPKPGPALGLAPQTRPLSHLLEPNLSGASLSRQRMEL